MSLLRDNEDDRKVAFDILKNTPEDDVFALVRDFHRLYEEKGITSIGGIYTQRYAVPSWRERHFGDLIEMEPDEAVER